MTEQIYSENSRKILQNKKLLESNLKVKISAKDSILFLEGKCENEYLALEVIEAINMGFSIPKALFLKEENTILKKILIKPIAKRNDLSQVRARIIGTKRKVMDTIESLTDTFLVLHDKEVGIIGSVENAEKAEYVLKRIITGSKHTNMYAWLEKKKAEERQAF